MRLYGLTQCFFRRCDVSDDMNMGVFETKFTPKGIILRDRSHTESQVLIALCHCPLQVEAVHWVRYPSEVEGSLIKCLKTVFYQATWC